MPDFLSDAEFEKYSAFIYAESGITFSAVNRAVLESRIKERLREKKADSPAAYYSMLKTDPEELKLFLDSVTTNLTRFFRNTAHFDAFVNYVLPEVIKTKQKRPGDFKVRVWSAGCSTGEEPYTIAMLLSERLTPPYKGEIVASDLSLKSLMVGKQGFYPSSRVDGVPPDYLAKYFDKKESGYQVKKTLIDMIRFDYHNLKNDPVQRNFDVVFCRNVLIYFDEAAQEAAVNRFWDAMNPHSFLFIGHSESLFGLNTKFEFLKTEWACLYQKNA